MNISYMIFIVLSLICIIKAYQYIKTHNEAIDAFAECTKKLEEQNKILKMERGRLIKEIIELRKCIEKQEKAVRILTEHEVLKP